MIIALLHRHSYDISNVNSGRIKKHSARLSYECSRVNVLGLSNAHKIDRKRAKLVYDV